MAAPPSDRPIRSASGGLPTRPIPNLDGGGKDFQYGDYTGISFVNGIIQPSWADNSVELTANPDRRFDTANARICRGRGFARAVGRARRSRSPAWKAASLSVPVARFTDPSGQADLSRYSASIDWGGRDHQRRHHLRGCRRRLHRVRRPRLRDVRPLHGQRRDQGSPHQGRGHHHRRDRKRAAQSPDPRFPSRGPRDAVHRSSRTRTDENPHSKAGRLHRDH